jgi:hypothetical protein
VKAPFCPRETDVFSAIADGRWPESVDGELQSHLAVCTICRDVATIAENLRSDAASLCAEATPPSSGIVWWRAQMRARQEAARVADRPISIVHALAIACVAGLALGLVGTVAVWVRGSASWLTGWTTSLATAAAQIGTVDLASRWLLLPLGVIVISLIVAPIALYAIVSDD